MGTFLNKEPFALLLSLLETLSASIKQLTSQQRLPAGTLRFNFLKSEVYYAMAGKGLDIAAKLVPRTIIKSPLILRREYYYCAALIACAPPKQMPKNSF